MKVKKKKPLHKQIRKPVAPPGSVMPDLKKVKNKEECREISRWQQFDKHDRCIIPD